MVAKHSFFRVVVSNIFLIFTPTWGDDPIWRAYFSDGLKPESLQSGVNSLVIHLPKFNHGSSKWWVFEKESHFPWGWFSGSMSKNFRGVNFLGSLQTDVLTFSFQVDDFEDLPLKLMAILSWRPVQTKRLNKLELQRRVLPAEFFRTWGTWKKQVKSPTYVKFKMRMSQT